MPRFAKSRFKMADIFGRTNSAGQALERRGNEIARQAKTFIREKRRAESRLEIEASVKEVTSYFRKKALGPDNSLPYANGECIRFDCANRGKYRNSGYVGGKCGDCWRFSLYKAKRKRKCKSA